MNLCPWTPIDAREEHYVVCRVRAEKIIALLSHLPLDGVGIDLDRADVRPSARAVTAARDEIGYVDLIPGSGHGAGGWSDVGAIEVYANAVKR